MIRYGRIENKGKREIVLLKGYPCKWGRCSFCDYIQDNDTNEPDMVRCNKEVLQQVTGEFGVLEVINSGSVFELPATTLAHIQDLVSQKNLRMLCFESYYAYRHRLPEIRAFFNIDILFKCGIETFDDHFRNEVLKKGIVFNHPSEVASFFESVCLLVGVQGQSREMIDRDIAILLKYFPYGCVNLYVNNTTPIKADEALQAWFKEKYAYLAQHPSIDVLWNNTDFGVGGDSL